MPPNASSIEQVALRLRQLRRAHVTHRLQNLRDAIVRRAVYLGTGKAKEQNPLRRSELVLPGIVLKLLRSAMEIFSVTLDDDDGARTSFAKDCQVIDVLVEKISRTARQSFVPY